MPSLSSLESPGTVLISTLGVDAGVSDAAGAGVVPSAAEVSPVVDATSAADFCLTCSPPKILTIEPGQAV